MAGWTAFIHKAIDDINQFLEAAGNVLRRLMGLPLPERAKTPEERAAEGRALENLGQINALNGEHDAAIDRFQQALDIARELGDRQGEGDCLEGLGDVHESREQYEEVIDYFQRALAIAHEFENQGMESRLSILLGNACLALKQYQHAIDYYEQAINCSGNLQDNVVVTNYRLFLNLGAAHSALGQYDKARYYKKLGSAKVVSFGTYLGNFSQLIDPLTTSFDAFLSLGDCEKASHYLNTAQNLARIRGDHHTISGLIKNFSDLGACYYQKDRLDDAIACFDQALALSREIGDQRGEGNALGNLGNAYHYKGDRKRALKCYRQARPIFVELELQGEVGEIDRKIDITEAKGR